MRSSFIEILDKPKKYQEDHKKLISIIMPAMNEELNLPKAYDEVSRVLAQMEKYDYEVIIIDNDSKDKTSEVCNEICHRDLRWKYIKFSRDFTSEISIAAGLRYAKGDAVIILFSDLQDPPELIPEFIQKWEEGYDLVCGLLISRADDSWWKNIGAKAIYFLLNKLSDIKLPQNVVDFRLMSRPVVDALNQLDERNRYFRGLAHWVGFKSCTIPFNRRPRINGKSKTSLFYLIDFAVRALTSFSVSPLRIFSGFGWLVLTGTVAYTAVTVVQLLLQRSIPGLTTIYLLLLFNLAFLALGIGTLGEYVGRIYVESKRRPLWIVEKTLNLEILDKERIVR